MNKLTKDARNGWTAETQIELSGDRVLTVTTMKRWDKSLTTTASVSKRSFTDGIAFLTFRMGGDGDFYKTLAKEQVRVTEKAVQTQHDKVLEQLTAIKQAALDYYDLDVAA